MAASAKTPCLSLCFVKWPKENDMLRYCFNKDILYCLLRTSYQKCLYQENDLDVGLGIKISYRVLLQWGCDKMLQWGCDKMLQWGCDKMLQRTDLHFANRICDGDVQFRTVSLLCLTRPDCTLFPYWT